MPVHNLFYLVNNQISPHLLRDSGPRVQVEIHVPPVLAAFREQRGRKSSDAISGWALFDTGASISAVDQEAVAQLGLNPAGLTAVQTPGGEVQQYLYPIRMVFPSFGNFTVVFNQVIGSELKPQGIIALVGRDVLANCLLVYNGPAGICSLSF